LFSGERPRAKSTAEIAELAEATDFYEEGSVERSYEGGSIKYVPPRWAEGAIGKAFMDGLVGAKFTIRGAAPAHFPQLITPGTYYTFLDFVEGGDGEQGRWIARVVDDDASISCMITGAEVSQEFAFHPGQDLSSEHSRPSISFHGVAPSDEPWATIANQPWAHLTGDWHEYATGCVTAHVCIPEVLH
jgi:hypothetical protein